MKESESQTGEYTASVGVASTASVASHIAIEAVPLVNGTVNFAFASQFSGCALPSLMNTSGWKMCPPEPVRGPPGTDVECQTIVA